MKYPTIQSNKTPPHFITQVFQQLVDEGIHNYTKSVSPFQKERRKKPKKYEH